MITISKARVTNKDIATLTKGRGSLVRNVLTASLPVSLAIGVATWLVSRSLPTAFFVGSALFLPSTLSNVSFFREVTKRSESADEYVEEIVVSAQIVVEVEHFGSHGPAWVFLGEDGQALLLVGQWLLRKKNFPSLDFSVYRWADSGDPIRMKSRGKRVRPESSNARFEADFRMSDIEVFQATYDTLQDDLRTAFGRKR